MTKTVNSRILVRELRNIKNNGTQCSIISTCFNANLIHSFVMMKSRWSQENFFKYVQPEDLPAFREATEKLIKKYLSNKEIKMAKKVSAEYLEVEERFQNIFGTKVKLFNNNKKGKIMIEYYSNEELERIIELVDSLAQK